MAHQEMNRKLLSKIHNQLVYLHQMKEKYSFPKGCAVFNGFGAILCEFNANLIDVSMAIKKLVDLLINDYDMMIGFNAVVPFGVHLEIPQNQNDTIKPRRLSWKRITSTTTVEMNRELNKTIHDTYSFVVKVHKYCSMDGLDFKTFVNSLHSYRIRKSKPDENVIADEVLYYDLNEFLKNREDLLEIFHHLRFPDYLSIIAFYFKYIPKLVEKICDHTKLELDKKFLEEIRKLTENEPEIRDKIFAVFHTNIKKTWSDEAVNYDEIRSAVAEMCKGREEWRTRLQNVRKGHL